MLASVWIIDFAVLVVLVRVVAFGRVCTQFAFGVQVLFGAHYSSRLHFFGLFQVAWLLQVLVGVWLLD